MTARITTVSAQPTDPVLAGLFQQIRSRGGRPLNLHRVLGHSPGVLQAHVGLAYALREAGRLRRDHLELAILRVARSRGGEYELAQHRPMALSCGLGERQIDAVGTWRESTLFDERQRAILAYADEMMSGGEVGDATFEQLSRHFDEGKIVELTVAIAFYGGAVQVTHALRIPVEEDAGSRSYGHP